MCLARYVALTAHVQSYCIACPMIDALDFVSSARAHFIKLLDAGAAEDSSTSNADLREVRVSNKDTWSSSAFFPPSVTLSSQSM